MLSGKLLAVGLCGLMLMLLVLVPTDASSVDTFSWTQPQSNGKMPNIPENCGVSLENYTTVRAWITVSGNVVIRDLVTAPIIQKGWSSVLDPAIAMDGRGNAIAMWTQQVADRTYNIFASVYTNGTGWGAPVQIQSGPTAFGPQVGFDAEGNAMAIFQVKVGEENFVNDPDHPQSLYNLFSCQYVVDSGWGPIQRVQNGPELAYFEYLLAVSSTGDAVAIWTQKGFDVCANHFTSGKGWDGAVSLFKGEGYEIDPQIAMDAEGNAVAVWAQSYQDYRNFVPGQSYEAGVNMPNYNFYSVYANCYVNGLGWLTTQNIQQGDGQAMMHPMEHHIAMTQNEIAIAEWTIYGSGGQVGSYNCTIYLGGQGGTTMMVGSGGSIPTDPSGDGSGVVSQADALVPLGMVTGVATSLLAIAVTLYRRVKSVPPSDPTKSCPIEKAGAQPEP